MIKALITTTHIFFVCCFTFMPSVTSAVVIDSRNWMQVTDTTNLSYNQLSNVCSVSTGICNGSINGIDLNGWIWADNSAVRNMFLSVTGAPLNTFVDAAASYRDTGAVWANEFIDIDSVGVDSGLFDVTLVSGQTFFVFGLTRSLINGEVDRSYITYTNNLSNPDYNVAIVGNNVALDVARSHTGHWLYQEIPVSAPVSTLGLLLVSLVVMVIRRKNSDLVKHLYSV